jgi:hypothetical protein
VSVELARGLHLAILAVGIIVWLLALRAHRRAFAPSDPLDPELLRSGELEVDAPAGELRDRLVESFRTGSATTGGAVLLEEAGPARVAGRITVLAGRQGRGTLGFAIDLADAGSRTNVSWLLRREGGSGLRTAGRVFVYILGPAALLAAALVFPTFVIGSDTPAVRFQTVQAIHVAHFLWPPFLLAWVARRIADTVETGLTNLIRNAAFS